MKKSVIVAVVVVVALAGVAYMSGMFGDGSGDEQAAGDAAGGDGRQGGANAQGGGFPGGGFPGGGFQGGGRGNRGGGRSGPMTVEVGHVTRASIAQELTVVGNLIGEATVAVAPRAAGRVQEVYVRLGDRVARGQRIAKIEDFELQEQIKQAEAAQEVSAATIRQREADLQLQRVNAERARNLFDKQLMPKQQLDDAESRYQAAIAQLDLARAQAQQSKARLDELRINLANTVVTSPVNGFIARRAVDPGASVGQNAPVVDVVDISSVRLVVNVVEKDLKQLQAGDPTRVQVDAYPGETFTGRIARVSPVLDPATRTAPIEIEIPNGDFRLKPGMYARVGITLDTLKDALVVPSDAVADLGGRRGVFQPLNGAAVFRTIQVGTEAKDVVEVLGGLREGEEVITTGARALRDGDRILLAGSDGEGDGVGRSGRGGPRGGGDVAPAGDAQPAPEAAGAATGQRQFGGREGTAGREGRRGGRRGGQPPADGTAPAPAAQ
jgi:HlyD family secretion protein